MEDSGIDSDPKALNQLEDERLFPGSDSSSSSNVTNNRAPTPQRSTTKQLQKKLEARIEQAKKIQRNSEYKKLPNSSGGGNSGSGSSAGLISIQRLPIPHKGKEHHPLVEYWESGSESEEEMTLYPLSRSKDSIKHKQELTDTFSVEELSEGSEDSLHLGPAQSSHPHARTYTPVGCFTCHCHIL